MARRSSTLTAQRSCMLTTFGCLALLSTTARGFTAIGKICRPPSAFTQRQHQRWRIPASLEARISVSSSCRQAQSIGRRSTRQAGGMLSAMAKAHSKNGSELRVSTPEWFAKERVRSITKAQVPTDTGRCVIYWMCRDQRAEDNWAMLFARHLAQQRGVPLVVAFVLGAWPVADPQPTVRYAGFMLEGLAETEQALRSKRIPFHLLKAEEPGDVVPALAKKMDASAIVTDMSPLRDPMRWVRVVGDKLAEAGDGRPLFQVDAHNVVPVWTTSDHLETMARTIRPKIHARPDLLTPFPVLTANPEGTKLPPATNWKEARDSLDLDESIKEITWLKPGPQAASDNLKSFIDTRMRGFADLSNDPNQDVCSHMSPYFNMGQISAQAAVLRVKKSKRHPEGVKAFVEQAVVRRELSDNLCFYNENYDSLAGAAKWASDSLQVHAKDPRQWTYTIQELEEGKTHEDLWNAAQLQLVKDGKMHNFLRMYWAKKILEWSPSPKDALERCIYFNDKYELDGRDPNGFAGCAWSVMGVHDMGWKERDIFGKIRYMNYEGCRRKFDVQQFVSKYRGAAAAAKAAGGTPAAPKRKPVAKAASGSSKKAKTMHNYLKSKP